MMSHDRHPYTPSMMDFTLPRQLYKILIGWETLGYIPLGWMGIVGSSFDALSRLSVKEMLAVGLTGFFFGFALLDGLSLLLLEFVFLMFHYFQGDATSCLTWIAFMAIKLATSYLNWQVNELLLSDMIDHQTSQWFIIFLSDRENEMMLLPAESVICMAISTNRSYCGQGFPLACATGHLLQRFFILGKARICSFDSFSISAAIWYGNFKPLGATVNWGKAFLSLVSKASKSQWRCVALISISETSCVM